MNIPLMDTLMQAGPFGVALLVILAMGGIFHRLLLGQLQERLQEHRADKAQLITVIQGNTAAIAGNTATVEQCTRAIDENTHLLQRLMETTGHPQPKTVPAKRLGGSRKS